MKIYTKRGDKGTTSLMGGSKIPKYHLRIESYGTVDELNSYIGLIRDQNIKEEHFHELIEIQDRLFTIGSTLAAEPGKTKIPLPQLKESDVVFLENKIDEMYKVLPPMRSFVLPGGHTTVSYCHIARCVCRRAERKIVQLAEQEEVPEIIIQYLNRLSDYLYSLSRKFTLDLNAREIPWVAKV